MTLTTLAVLAINGVSALPPTPNVNFGATALVQRRQSSGPTLPADGGSLTSAQTVPEGKVSYTATPDAPAQGNVWRLVGFEGSTTDINRSVELHGGGVTFASSWEVRFNPGKSSIHRRYRASFGTNYASVKPRRTVGRTTEDSEFYAWFDNDQDGRRWFHIKAIQGEVGIYDAAGIQNPGSDATEVISEGKVRSWEVTW